MDNNTISNLIQLPISLETYNIVQLLVEINSSHAHFIKVDTDNLQV